MTTTQLQLRRDTTANIDGITPAQGEPIYDVTRKALVLGDGATVGGNCVTPFTGTWTPALVGSTTNPTVTATSAGWFVQIGPLVIAQGMITVSAISGGSGSAYIADASGYLPAPVAGANTNGGGAATAMGGFTFHSSSYTQVGLNVAPNGGIFFEESGSGVTGFQSQVGQIGATFTIEFMVLYQATQPTG